MTQFTTETKEAIVKKALSRPAGKALKQVADENNIGLSTLGKWLKKVRNGERLNRRHKDTGNNETLDKPPLTHLLAAANLDETQIGAYCREHGIYSFQLKEWKGQLMKQNTNNKHEKINAEVRALRAENKRLKQDLHRKDKALAETSALLVLKKKADLIWEDLEED